VVATKVREDENDSSGPGSNARPVFVRRRWRRWRKFDAALSDIGADYYDQERHADGESVGGALDGRGGNHSERDAHRCDCDANDERERRDDL